MIVERLDYGAAGKIVRLDNGFLRVPLTATRAGIFVYKDQTGKEWRELRPHDEVFHVDSIDSLKGVPVTNNHPKQMLNSMNAKDHIVGYTSDIIDRDKHTIKTTATITHKDTIDEVDKGGKSEVSCGYVCDLEWKPGVYQGQHYDAIQTKIRYNHVAIVKKGRAGPEVRLHLDGQEEQVMRFDSYVEFDEGQPHPKQDDKDLTSGGSTMKVLVIGGVEIKLDDAAYDAVVSRLKKDSEELEAVRNKVVEAEKAKTQAEAKCDSLTAEVTSMKAKMDDAAAFNARVAARVKLEAFAKNRVDGEVSTMTDDQIIVKLIQKKTPEFKADGKDSVYLQARLDHLMETEVDVGGAFKDIKAGVSEKARNDSDGKTETADEMRKRRMREDSDAWKSPLGKQQAK